MIDRPPAGAGRDDDNPRALIAPPISHATDERPAGVFAPIADTRPVALDDLDALLDAIDIVELPTSNDPQACVAPIAPSEMSKILTDTQARKALNPLHSRASSRFPVTSTSVKSRRHEGPHTPKDKNTSTRRQARPKKSPEPANPFTLKPSLPGCRQRRVPHRYEELGDRERFALWGHAIAALGPVASLTVNLRPDRARFYRAQKRTASKLHADILRHLEKEFGRKIQLAIHLEETDDGRLHLHGLASILAEEAERARAAMRRAVGEWAKYRQYQTHTEADPDEYWAGHYCTKNRNDPKRSLYPKSQSGRFLAININGKPYSVSTSIRSKAQDFYNEWRISFIEKSRLDISASFEVTNNLPKNNPATVTENPLAEEPILTQRREVDHPSKSAIQHDDAAVSSPSRHRRLTRRPRRRGMRWHARFRALRGPRQPPDRARASRGHLARRDARHAPGYRGLRIRPGTGPP